jgi:transcriptional regulator with XRE-family HTH domain
MRNSLKDMMARRGITAQDVATALGCHRETVYRWMQNRTRISDRYDEKLMIYLNCTVAELLGLEVK